MGKVSFRLILVNVNPPTNQLGNGIIPLRWLHSLVASPKMALFLVHMLHLDGHFKGIHPLYSPSRKGKIPMTDSLQAPSRSYDVISKRHYPTRRTNRNVRRVPDPTCTTSVCRRREDGKGSNLLREPHFDPPSPSSQLPCVSGCAKNLRACRLPWWPGPKYFQMDDGERGAEIPISGPKRLG